MKHLPNSTFPKSRLQLADEYGMEVRSFKRKLLQAGIKLPPGQILPRDQMRIYKALGSPFYVWTDKGSLIPFVK